MPTGQVFRWHCRAITHPIANSDAVPKPNSSAPRIEASTTSRANFRPPSTRRESRERRPARTSVSCASRKPISQGRPVFLMEVNGEEPVPPLCPLRSEEHTSELQSRFDLVCRLLLEKK